LARIGRADQDPKIARRHALFYAASGRVCPDAPRLLDFYRGGMTVFTAVLGCDSHPAGRRRIGGRIVIRIARPDAQAST